MKEERMLKKIIILFLITVGSLETLMLTSCKAYLDGVGTSTILSSLTANTIGSGGGTSVTFTAPTGTAYSTVTVDEGSQFLAANVCSTATIYGLPGSASCSVSGTSTVVSVLSVLQSGASRDSTATQITVTQEVSTYAGVDFPAGVRDIPAVATDDDGGSASSVVTRLNRANNNTGGSFNVWNTGVARKECGMGIATIAGRIASCDAQHATKPSWDTSSSDGKISWSGATSGFGLAGEGSWTLVTVYALGGSNGTTCPASNTTASSCREVWRDDRTGLLWSDRIGSNSTIGTANIDFFTWCTASGNTQNVSGDCRTSGNGGLAGSTYNFAGISLCAEAAGLTTPIGTADAGNQVALYTSAWTEVGTAVRDAKGGMLKTANSDPAGLAQSPSVRWRLPTKWDYQQADNDGIRLVLPNFYTGNENVWSASLDSGSRTNVWLFGSLNGGVASFGRAGQFAMHCIGR
jgi:hypothetical protein